MRAVSIAVFFSANLFLGCAAGGGGLGAAAVEQKQTSYDDLLFIAARSTRDGNTQRAITAAQRAVQQAPKRPEAYGLWGRALAQLDRLDEAAYKYELARTKGTRQRYVFTELASIYDVTQRYDKALAVYDDYLRDHPRDPEVLQQKGLTLLLLERFDAAVAALREATAHTNASQVVQDLGYALMRAGRTQDAATTLERLLQQKPDRIEAMRFAARAHAANGDPQRALFWLDRALGTNPQDTHALHLRGRLKALTGDGAGALRDYESLSRFLSDPKPAWRELRSLADRTGDKPLAAAAQSHLDKQNEQKAEQP